MVSTVTHDYVPSTTFSLGSPMVAQVTCDHVPCKKKSSAGIACGHSNNA